MSTKKFEMRIFIAKQAINRQILVLTCKVNIELRKKLGRCSVWGITLYISETSTLQKLERMYLESFEVWCRRIMEKIKWLAKFLNVQGK